MFLRISRISRALRSSVSVAVVVLSACAGGQVVEDPDLGRPVSDLGDPGYSDAAPEFAIDAKIDLGFDLTPDVGDGAAADTGPDGSLDATPVDSSLDTGGDSVADLLADLLSPDASAESGVDVGSDLGFDLVADTLLDLPADLLLDLSTDAKADAIDAGPAAEVCDNGVDDDLDGLIDCADGDCGAVGSCLSTNRTLVIHEIYPGAIDYLSLRNASTSPRNIADYSLTLIGLTEISYVLPSKTLSPGEVVHIFEHKEGNPALGDIQTNANIPFYDALTTESNAVILRNPADEVIDYVGLGQSLAGTVQLNGGIQTPGPVSYVGFDLATQSHYRSAISGTHPTFLVSDWSVGPKSR